ncbi:MAG: DUF1343 domain-containing protein [Candidatus Omnitrophica bacterium]|nr:DUF1343 domain-containing protein [Candidatus Omnitrophota bacterium]
MKNIKRILFALACLFSMTAACENGVSKPAVKLGIEVLAEKEAGILKGKKVGLITNLTGVDSKLRSSIDIIYGLKAVKLTTLFAPEHGIRGGVMGYTGNEIDGKTGLPVFTVETAGPSEKMLEDVEILLFDMQDIGSRSYTYITTMKKCMEAAAKYKIPFVVLDRPNPIGGLIVDGPVLDMAFQSDIGIGPLAYVHGMTVGEIAGFFNEKLNINCDLRVIKMEGWKRSMFWEDTGLVWVPTSPHIPEPDTPFFYPVTGILGELPMVSVGVGYTLPFKIVGAPWMDAEKITASLNAKKLPGVYFQPFHFTPFYRFFSGGQCHGFRIVISDKKNCKPVATGYHIIDALLKNYPENFNFNGPLGLFDKANGTDIIRKQFQNGISAEDIIGGYRPALKEFIERRKKYLLYE